jgi:protocatechuate 3,4-dioxygenase beta subunit
MRHAIRQSTNVFRWLPAPVLLATFFLLPSSAQAGSYIVAQCSPGVYTGADDAGFTASTTHYTPRADCSPSAPGLQITHTLFAGETGTVQGGFGAWVWTAPAGTYITGGSTFSRLATESGQHGYLAVSPDSGAGLSYENQNDDQGHEAGIPAGNWRYLVARLECTQPNENNRCVGAAGGAHTYIKQVRIQLTDVVSPTISIGGSMFSGAELRGPQTISVSAADRGAGLRSVQVVVNGQGATGDDLSGSCNPLPGNMTSRLSPCPPSFGKAYTLDTAQAPFREGVNSISVCAYDYAQTGTPNAACESKEVLVNNLCPGSSVGGGNTITAGFAGNHKGERTLAFRRRALIRGRLHDPAGNPVANAQVCLQGHTDLPGRSFHLIGTATTNENGGWTFKVRRGPSRSFRVAYRFGAFQTSTDLTLHMRTRVTLHLSRHRTRVHKRIYFSGEIAGPSCALRVVVMRGTVPGAKRRFLVRRAKTDALCHYRAAYAFSPVPRTTRFVFNAVVPEQNGYPYVRGHSVPRYIRVRR